MCWAKWWLPKRYVHVLTCAVTLRVGRVRMNVGLSWGWWEEVLIPGCPGELSMQPHVPCKRGRGHFGQTHREKAVWRRRQRLQPCVHETRNAKEGRNHRQIRKEARRRLSRGLRGSTALLTPTPWFQTRGLQSWERIRFHCLKPPSVWWFATAAPGKSFYSLSPTHLVFGKWQNQKQSEWNPPSKATINITWWNGTKLQQVGCVTMSMRTDLQTHKLGWVTQQRNGSPFVLQLKGVQQTKFSTSLCQGHMTANILSQPRLHSHWRANTSLLKIGGKPTGDFCFCV